MNYITERGIVCKNLRRLRFKRGLTLKQVSEETGIPAGTLGSYEHEFCKPSSERIGILANFYGLPEDYFYDVHMPNDLSQHPRRVGLAVTVWNGRDWEVRTVALINKELQDRLEGHKLGSCIQKTKKEVYKQDRLMITEQEESK